MTSTLAGTVSIVTGAASGIGRATALALAAEGAAVALVDRDGAALDTVAAVIGAQAHAITCDLADLAAVPGIVAQALERFGRVDHLVNCAGITGTAGTVLAVDLDSWDEVYAVNLKAPLLLMQHVANHMVARGGGGRIVNVSSSSAFRARLSQIAYGSSKAALVQLTRSAAAELGPHDINVNAVAPGLTKSAITARLGDDDALTALVTGDGTLANLLGRVSEPEDVAAVIVFLCAPASRQITGQTIHTSAGAVV
ncbi:MAG: SDR family oxidoreductase [Acidobacteria bacterium]|nr:SDR family oxidoreductase [Acidobacteriota bacterium]